MSHKRPEHILPPELYYNEEEARKYTSNTHIIDIQTKMSERAVELLALPDDEPCLILDIGCGSGLSGEVLSDLDHTWIGVDISRAMLDIAQERSDDSNLILSDVGSGLPFRAASFDAALSISAIQWLCNADKSSHNPVKRIRSFFRTLYACLKRGGRAVLQFYPENPDQLVLLEVEAMRAGFTGGLLVDFPNSTKAKKYFLVLNVGGSALMPAALSDESNANQQVKFESRRQERRDNIHPKRSKAWIMKKKDKARNQQKEVPRDSKFTGRKRKPKF